MSLLKNLRKSKTETSLDGADHSSDDPILDSDAASEMDSDAASATGTATSLFDSSKRRRSADPAPQLSVLPPMPPDEMATVEPAEPDTSSQTFTLSDDAAPPMPPAPRRRWRRRSAPEMPPAVERVRIDEVGLLEVLGLPPDASLAEVGAAHRTFLADHDPDLETDLEARTLKRQIRREANAAYASYRLLKGR